MFSSSQSSEPCNSTPNGGTVTRVAHSSDTGSAALSAASIAQNVDRIAQEHGLTHESRQKLFLFAVQSNPAAESLRIFAFMLQNSEAIRGVSAAVAALSGQLHTLAGLTRRDWQMSPAQESTIRLMVKNHIIMSTTSYEDLNERSKAYLSSAPGQFGMTVYATDTTVRSIVNKYIDSESHQIRGAFRKVIFTTVARSSRSGTFNSLESVAIGFVKTYSNERTDAPVFIQAHVAQLRLIAVDIMCAMPIPPPAPAPGSSSAGQTKRPKQDTGFWTKVNEVFGNLVKQHGTDYHNSNGWRVWEEAVIAEHTNRIQSAANLIPPEVVRMFIGPSSF